MNGSESHARKAELAEGCRGFCHVSIFICFQEEGVSAETQYQQKKICLFTFGQRKPDLYDLYNRSGAPGYT